MRPRSQPPAPRPQRPSHDGGAGLLARSPSTPEARAQGGAEVPGGAQGPLGARRRVVARGWWAASAVALTALALGGLGCDLDVADGSTATLTYTEDARLAYQEAMNAYRNKDWEDARALFEEVRQRFAQSRYARLAELRIADIAFIQEKYTDAIASYRDFITSHRSDRFVEYAKYRTAKALYLDIDDTLLLPPAEERDQATTMEAHRELRAFIRQYPTTQYRREALYMLEVVTGRLARHELYVARYYLRTDVFEAAVARCDYALANYPGSGLDAEALVLKGETLMKMDRDADARAVFQQVIQSYGGPFSVTAKAFLEELESPSQPPPQIRRVQPAAPPPVPAATPPAPGSPPPPQ